MGNKTYFVYILASVSGVLYTGVTNNLQRRVAEHRKKLLPGFSANYNAKRLVYFEPFGEVRMAIAREKQVKSWRREKRIKLIEAKNPKWADLSTEWFS
jgi:putative endonuclease